MTKAAMAILADLDKDTVDFKDNYDGSESEPVVRLPSRIPNLLVNGAGGIAVGMATNIPPHNLRPRSWTPAWPSSTIRKSAWTSCSTSCRAPTSPPAARSSAGPARATP